MIKYALVFLIATFSTTLFSQEFEGCGEYVFKGILKHNEKAPLKVIYIVHEGTKSQMVFSVKEKEDVMKLALMIDLPSTFKGSITKLMDGTKGVVTFPYEIANRAADPLKSNSTGIAKIKSFKCD